MSKTLLAPFYLGLMLIVCSSAATARGQDAEAEAGPSAAAAAAKQQFDAKRNDYMQLLEKIKSAKTQRDQAAGASRNQLDLEIAELRRQSHQIVAEMGEACLAAYAADPDAYPDLNSTILAFARFYLVGDAGGDGGDQYDKALPMIKGLLDAGAGDQWKDLWLWGGLSAYCTNEFDLAEQYFAKARESGALSINPPTRNPNDPRWKIWELAVRCEENLPAVRRTWQREQHIRSEEAKADNLPRVKLTTNRGEILLELFEDQAPEAVANFITLARKGYYDDVVFHRVLPAFMAQGGDPEGTGGGGPGYTIRDEFARADFRRHFRGSLAMARTQAPNSSGSQFYLSFLPTTQLDGQYTVFGRVLEGMDVAASLKRRNPQDPEPKPQPDRIIKAEVVRDRGHGYLFEQLPE